MTIRGVAVLGFAMLIAAPSLSQEASRPAEDQKHELPALRLIRSHKISDAGQSNDETRLVQSTCGTAHALCPVW